MPQDNSKQDIHNRSVPYPANCLVCAVHSKAVCLFGVDKRSPADTQPAYRALHHLQGGQSVLQNDMDNPHNGAAHLRRTALPFCRQQKALKAYASQDSGNKGKISEN